ncbi:MAG TPA: DUF6748 domain-containing protein [Pyrinomonadaceae bacterium]|jgi:hypothetical protein|nr:DUF6748 domain-containing protein [Pyrinomonadaceae bacterium]
MRVARTFRTLALVLILSVLAFSGGAFARRTDHGELDKIPDSAVPHTFPKPEPATDNSTYYLVRRDLRRCASPMCGGFFVRRVNFPTTPCTDGKNSSECYVSEIQWNGHEQVETGKALLRGIIAPNREQRFRKFGSFQVSEVWQAAGEKNPSGDFYRVRDLGVRCIAAPCPTHHEAKLNTTEARNIAGVDLSHVGATEESESHAVAYMTGNQGILVAGEHERVTGPAGRSEKLNVTQFYLLFQNPAATGSSKPCIRTGCSKQICADHNVMSTCEWREEYECYRKASCERQADGDCGFTKTPELASCLKRKP